MRVVAGRVGGVKLKTPKGMTTRPTIERVKESLFSILQSRLADASVLDLFAGTGSLAIEALSRGAASAVLVDNDPDAADCILFNLEKTGLVSQAILYRDDYKRAIHRCSRKGILFDLIFVDPPYNTSLLKDALYEIANAHLLEHGGIIVAEHDSRVLPPIPIDLTIKRNERYGDTSLTFIIKEDG